MAANKNSSNLTVTRFFQARAAWHWELAEAILAYNRCGLVVSGRNQLSAVGGPRTTRRAIRQFKELLKVLRQLSAHLNHDKRLRKSLCAGMASVLVNEFLSASKQLPKSVRIYLDTREDLTTRSRDYDSRRYTSGVVAAADML